ncbi:MAG: 16S rRNA (adenine(1518)-N(6)/adenine(1519)-N(6))-dimethyltransferase RsmA [Actinomycetota bacterium]
MTHSRPTIRTLLDSHDLRPRRDLGQNFVADPNTVRRIAELAHVEPGDHVAEIGAGLGSLTLALAETGASVTAIEVDDGLIEPLRAAVAEHPNVTVLHADAMTLNWTSALDPAAGPWVVVANLPYNVATPLVCDILDTAAHIERLVVMVQREVADRFVAVPRTAAYGAVSVKIAYWASARIVAHVPASVFVPRPNVESAVVEVSRRDGRTPGSEGSEHDPSAVFDLVRTAFQQRRKMLRKSLGAAVTAEQFTAAGVEPTARPEELDVDAWLRLARAVGAPR